MTTRGLTIAVFLVLGLLLAALELGARRQWVRVPPLGTVVRAMMAHRSAQLAIVLAWWWLGWHFFCDPT